jgi:hypothetical protein
VISGVIALACALGLVFTASLPAEAAGMRSISGNIRCTAFPVVTVGTSAYAKGTVAFQLMAINNSQSLYYQTLGYTSNYANWGWKFWTMQAGNFYAYGLGSNGAVSSVNRWCAGI